MTQKSSQAPLVIEAAIHRLHVMRWSAAVICASGSRTRRGRLAIATAGQWNAPSNWQRRSAGRWCRETLRVRR
jgi:hypothetical protein